MYSKEQYLNSLGHEFSIIRHLAAKLTEGEMEYRPTQEQRSVRELLQYMSMIFIATAEAAVAGNASGYQKHSEMAQEVTLANFDEHMASQMEKVIAVVTPLTDAQMAEEVEIWGKMSRADYFINLLKFAAAYKTQLFTYMKQNGHSTLNTMNLWAGKDAESAA